MNQLKAMAAAGLIATALPASAQPPVAAGEAEVVVSELVVPSEAGGPAWWKVSDADSRVYILVIPQTAPRNLDWDRTLLERRLDGASRLYLPVGMSLNPASLLGVAGVAVQAPKIMKQLGPRERPKGDKTTLEEKLPPDVREKFVAMRTKIGKPASAYEILMPDAAAQQIEEDYRAWAGLGAGPLADIRAIARRKKVPDQPIAKFSVPLTKIDFKATGDRSSSCLAGALDLVERQAREDRRVAEAWAKGDPRPLLNPARRPPDTYMCRSVSLSATPAQARAVTNGLVQDEVKVITAALKRPGKIVVVLNGREMFLADGVLTKLKAMGYEVTTPDALRD